MAVYKKTYTLYEGRFTARWPRFLVLTRYTLEDLRASRFYSLFFLACFIAPLVAALIIYSVHNISALEVLGIQPNKVLTIGPQFFMNLMGMQSVAALFLVSFVGPGLVAPDLANNGLSLYLSRPISKTEYVLGRLTVLVGLLSFMTWIPGLLLFWLQAHLEGGTWWWDNMRIASGIFFGSWIWVLLISLQSVAISAWVKWKPVAGALMFGVFFVAAGFGAAINEVIRTKWGHLINLSHLMGAIWVTLYEIPMKRGQGAWFFRVARGEEIPIWACWSALLALCGLWVFMLSRRIRGVEVVK
jgi:ABC-2 type transport system permease protein